MAAKYSKSGVRFISKETLISKCLLGCTLVSILTTVGIVVILLAESLQFFKEVSFWEFITGTRWTPVLLPQSFGVLPIVCGTFLIAVGAAIVAIPIGLGTAVCLSEYAPPKVREIIKPIIEVLAGVPSVVFGYLAIITITPIIQKVFPSAGVFNAASACIVVGFMILPMIVSLSDDALRAVPSSLRQGAYALGATKLDVTARVVLPAASSGIIASFMLAISRAVGETMAVTLAAGATPNMTLNPLDSIQTMTAFIVQTIKGETQRGTIEYQTLFAVGLVLFAFTMLLNVGAQFVLKRMREKYE